MNNEELFEKNINLAYKIANTYRDKYPTEYEDIKQVALIGLWKAVQKYDGVSKLSPFAGVVINREIIRYTSKQIKHLETSHLEASSPNGLEILGCVKSEEEEIEDMITKNDNDNAFKELIQNANLTPKEKETLKELRKGLNIIQIAQKHNVSKQRISQRKQNIFRKIEKARNDGKKEKFM